jgi:cellulose synthase/poly-beta-1,6-N-acetylglucosamine synthase-like glycosyltransferase
VARALRWCLAGLVLAQGWLGASVAYLLALLGAGARPVGPRSTGAVEDPPPLAVLVPAHDEEAGVAATVKALVAQDYPRDRLAVIVIADNCTDDTAAVAAETGATVWTRDVPSARGKGPALAWALDRLRRELPSTEGVLVVDADCLASPNLCAAVAAELLDPAVQAVQVRYEVSNAEESPTAALRAAGFMLKHVIRARGRARLRLSCGLFGSGMGFRRSLFDAVQWPASVTEDTELHLRLVERGVIVRFAERAAVRSAMPTTASAAVEQQMRWESGNAQLAGGYVVRLLTRGAMSGDVQLLGAAAELLVPSQSMLAAGSLGIGAAATLLGRPRTALLAAATLAGQAVYVVGGLAAAQAPGASVKALAHAPGFVAARLRVLGRVASGRRAQTWVRTTREG